MRKRITMLQYKKKRLYREATRKQTLTIEKHAHPPGMV